MGDRLSIIIVNYNTRDLLLDCLRSIAASSDTFDKQVIVVDNASADGSVDAVRREFPAYTVLASPENLGFSRANNLGLEHATGDYVLLLNPDTVVEPDVFAKTAEYLKAHPDVGMVSCKLVLANGRLDLACRRSFPSLWDGFCRAAGLSALFPKSRLFSRYNMTYLDEDATCEVESIVGAFMFVRRQALDQVGLLDPRFFMYAEDLDWCYRFRQAGWKIVYHPAARTRHFKGQSSSHDSARMIREMFRSQELFYEKHHYPNMGFARRALIRGCLKLWKASTLARNAIRRRKRVRP